MSKVIFDFVGGDEARNKRLEDAMRKELAKRMLRLEVEHEYPDLFDKQEEGQMRHAISDPRYVDSDDARARLTAYWHDLPMGGWTDDDEPAFRAAVIAQLSDDLVPDGSATPEEIRSGLEIGKA
jgi:hypothetical protein